MNKKDWPRRRVLLSKISTAVAFSLLMSSAFASTTWYVNPNGSNDASGTDAASAFKTLHHAHDKAAAGDTILLSEGTHNLTNTFIPAKKLFIRGAGRSKTIIKQTMEKNRVFNINTDNKKAPTGSVIEDIGITGADYSTQDADVYGAGLLLKADCTIRNCDIYGNKMKQGRGVGAYITKGELDGCRIYENVATDDADSESYGGGVYIDKGSPTLKNCLIYNNHAANYGGGITVYGKSSSIIRNCTIIGNSVAICTSGASGFYSQENENFGKMENTVIVGNIDNGTNSKSWDSSSDNGKFNNQFRNCAFDFKPYGVTPITAEADDLFEEFGGAIYTPKYASPLMDRSYDKDYSGDGDVDVYGNNRKSGAGMDIGAVERNLAENALLVTAKPKEFSVPTLDYGTYLFSQKGEQLSLTVPDYPVEDEASGSEYVAAGWELYSVDSETSEEKLVDSGTGVSYTYENVGGFHVLVWQFLATVLAIDVSVEGVGGTVESENYSVKRGEEVTIKAFAEPGYVLKEWIGDIPGGIDVTANPLKFTPEKSMGIKATFVPVRYVSITGSDTNNGFTPETAWKDVTFAVSNMNCIGKGAVLNIGEGTHDVIKELVVTNSIVIRGEGRERTILKPTMAGYRVIGIGENKNCKATTKDITIEKLAISGVRSTNNNLHGCGIYIGAYASNVNVRDLDVFDNALSKVSCGGGVYMNLATAHISRCRIYNNHATGDNATGAGVYIGPNGGTIENSLICGNSAYRSGGSDRGECGGGLHIGGPGKIYNCTIISNEDTQTGHLGGAGGFYADVATFKMINTAVVGNHCPGSISRFGSAWSCNPSCSLSALSNCFVNCAFDCEPIGLGSVKCDISQFKITDGNVVKVLPNYLGINAGCDSAYSISPLDLEGGSRVKGGTVDIGAQEFDSDIKSIAFSPVKSEIFLGETVAYTAVAADSVVSPSYDWSVTNATGEVVYTATGAKMEFTPESYGSYGVALTATSGGESMFYEVGGAVLVSSQKIYVSSHADESAAAAPFATPETATASLEKALKWAIDGSEVFVKGTNSASINISRAVTVTGEGGRKADRIKARSGRVAVLRHPGALLRGLTLSGGAHYRGPGAYIACGTVENCRVTGNTVKDLAYYDCQGSVYVGDADARVSRTIIDNNVVTYNLGRGAGAYVCFGALDNCLISSNRAYSGAGVLLANSSAKIINCTVANNIDSVGSSTIKTDYGAGVFVGSPSQQVINSVFYGNMHEGSASDWKTTLAAEDVASVFSNCAFTAFEDGTFPSPSTTCAGVTASDFINLTSFQPAPQGALHNKGALDYVYSKGAIDLLGRTRVLGRVDIGCYEVQGEGFYIIIR